MTVKIQYHVFGIIAAYFQRCSKETSQQVENAELVTRHLNQFGTIVQPFDSTAAPRIGLSAITTYKLTGIFSKHVDRLTAGDRSVFVRFSPKPFG